MANTKAQSVREIVIDGCLSGSKWFTMQEIIDKCNRALEDKGFPTVSSKQTILDDFVRIETQWGIDATIEKTKGPLDKRRYVYHYKKSNFSIYKTILSGDDLLHLEQLISLLEGFKGLPPLGWLDQIKEKLRKHLELRDNIRSFIELEGSELQEWGKYLSILAESISENEILKIVYRKFEAASDLTYKFRPTYLRQFNGRWYLYGFTVGYKNISTIPLDRIKEVTRTNQKFEPIDFDYDLFFHDVYGATVHQEPGTDVEIVKIQVLTRKQLDYIKTRPLHSTQQIESDDANGGIISIEVILNYELEKLIMSFGEKIKVLEPLDFANHIADRFRQCSQLYNN